MTRVFVGMSGGVDSSLAAAPLVEHGYDVTGVYMKNWSQDLPGMRCPWADDLADAKRVAVQLGIDFVVFDFEQQYRDKVVQYMIDEYKLGRTPNPDIMCNQEVKFKLFLHASLEQGADMIATGHYARALRGAPDEQLSHLNRVSPADARDGVSDSNETIAPVRLALAEDAMKDQTYFLYRVTADALSKTLFPLGDYTKAEVREMAQARGLWTAGKKESMGVCFVGQVGMRDFLSQYVEPKQGDIIEKSSGKVLGKHDGAIFYTLGQRHGLDVGGGLPYYVVGKDMDKNEVYVSQNMNDESMWRKDIELTAVHWINEPARDGEELKVRLRHRGKLLTATYSGGTLHLAEQERAVAAGQSAVLYHDQECLGGGIVIG